MDEREDEAADDSEEDEPGLAELCPEVFGEIASSELAPFLLRDWGNGATIEELERFRELLTSEVRSPGRRPDTSTVGAIVERMEKARVVRDRTLWERFSDWIKGLLAERAAKSESNWFDDWLREHEPSARALRWTAYGIVSVLIAAVAWIVYVELRAAGLLTRRRRVRPVEGNVAGLRDAEGNRLTLDGASDAELPSLLIARVLDQLRRLGRVQDRLSMTHRELARAARFDAATESDTFRELLATSERIRYDAVAPEAAGLRRVIENSRRLLESLARLPREVT